MKEESRKETSASTKPKQDEKQGPPHNDYMEKSLLGAILLDNAVMDEIAPFVPANAFYSVAHQEIFRSMLELYNTDKPIDLILLTHELKRRGSLELAGGYIEVARLEQIVLSTGHSIEMADEIMDLYKLRQICDLAKKSYLRSVNGEETHQIITDISDDVARIGSLGKVERGVTASKAYDKLMAEIHETKKSGKPPRVFYDTQIKGINKDLRGIDDTALWVIAARPSVGKSAFALSTAMHIAQTTQTPIGIFSLEMQEDQIVQRMMANLSHVPLHGIRRPESLIDGQIYLLQSVKDTIDEMPIHIMDAPGLTIERFQSSAIEMQKQFGKVVFVIDYLQLMQLPNSRRSTNDLLADTTKKLKKIAMNLRCPIILLSQMSRDSEKNVRIPRLSDLRDSGAIEQDADVVMFLYKAWIDPTNGKVSMEAPDSDHFKYVIAEVAKNRNGALGRTQLGFEGAYQRFCEIVQEETN